MFSNINGISLFVPETFAGILPVSPSYDKFDFEPYAFSGLRKAVKPGDIVFDLGVSYGVMTTLMATMVGDQGKVHSFEANEDVTPYQKQLADSNGVLERVSFNQCLIGEKSNQDSEFYVIASYQSVASTRNPRVLRSFPEAEKRNVRTLALDDYCEQNNIIPNSVKIDIEGAEFQAIRGFERTIKRYFPTLIIETHHSQIEGIGGNIQELTETLEGYGYSLFDLNEDRPTNAKEFTSKYSSKIGNLLCERSI